MGKNLTPKIILIVVLLAVAGWTLYPPGKTLKPGIDLAGGTSLIYEIDTTGMTEVETADLAQRMITVLRRRIDPANIQNLVWRPQGNTRFEIQMPLASAESRVKRQAYEQSRDELLADNVNPATVLRSLQKPQEERIKDFERYAHGSKERLELLTNLALAYDEWQKLQTEADRLDNELKAAEEKITSAGLNVEQVKQNQDNWLKLPEEKLSEALRNFLGSEENLDLLTGYVNTYAQWFNVTNRLPEKHTEFNNASLKLGTLNLTEDQLNVVLEMPPKLTERKQKIEQLKTDFADRAQKIDKAIVAFDEYRPYRGRLDDPDDLRRMLKGAGILEFRILPTVDGTALTSDEIKAYIESLTTKGPKYASDDKYVWCEIEDIKEWNQTGAIVAAFGSKSYVLASNKPDETLLHSLGQEKWQLVKAQPSTDSMGRRAISFLLDERGGKLFFNVTGKNIGRPLCILLDGLAISAPNIQSRIRTEGQITGSFTPTAVTDMVNKLNAGSLPARLIEQPISIRTIGPSIGADNRDQGIRAGLIGTMLVIACVAGYYLLGGFIADAALLMNLLFTLAIMAGMRATFTLPGIAGVILTIGMSVDANVLIFERIREEQQKGMSLRTAIKNGYEKAFSAIFDSNLTTVISAAILYWVGSEDIKGFAIVLMLGLSSNIFTAVFVTRVIFEFLLSKKLIKERLLMLQLIHRPNINWMKYRPVFFIISGVLTIGGIIVFFTRNDVKNNKYDIEFTGGTSVQINLKKSVNLSRQEVQNRIDTVLAGTNVYSVGQTGQSYEITTTETNKITATITFTEPEQAGQQTVQSITAEISKAEAKLSRNLKNLTVTQSDEQRATSFVVSTSEINPSLVKNVLTTAFPNADISEPKANEVVNDAVRTAFKDELEIQRNLQPEITSKEKITKELAEAQPELADFLGGIKIEYRIGIPATPQELDRRMSDLRFKPDTQNLDWNVHYTFFDLDMKPVEPNYPLNSFVYVSAQPDAGIRELTADEWTSFVENETTKVTAATTLEASLPRVTQISASVGAEAKQRALIAIILSLAAILIYIWFRFGDLRFGVGAVVTLFHDTCVNVGMVTACTYIAATFLGQKLLIGDFKINLAMIAAFLTLLGYSINDTIVIYDRIRENRRKGTLTSQIINDGINDTLSRTLLTSTTTLIVVFIMYVSVGAGLRGFNFAILFGIIEGTYSSIAISAPLLLLWSAKSAAKNK